MGLQNLVGIIRRNKSNPAEIFRAYALEEDGFLQLPATIPALIYILQEIQIWTFVCLASLILARACQRARVDDKIREGAIQAVLLAYEPNSAIDDGMTAAAKTLALATLGFKPAVQHLQASAQSSGYADIKEYGNALFARVILTIASRPDEED